MYAKNSRPKISVGRLFYNAEISPLLNLNILSASANSTAPFLSVSAAASAEAESVISPVLYLKIIKASAIVISPSASISPNLHSSVTVTLQVAVKLPTFAVIVASPLPTAVTFPLETVATEVFEDDQVTVLLSVVLEGL